MFYLEVLIFTYRDLIIAAFFTWDDVKLTKVYHFNSNFRLSWFKGFPIIPFPTFVHFFALLGYCYNISGNIAVVFLGSINRMAPFFGHFVEFILAPIPSVYLVVLSLLDLLPVYFYVFCGRWLCFYFRSSRNNSEFEFELAFIISFHFYSYCIGPYFLPLSYVLNIIITILFQILLKLIIV